MADKSWSGSSFARRQARQHGFSTPRGNWGIPPQNQSTVTTPREAVLSLNETLHSSTRQSRFLLRSYITIAHTFLQNALLLNTYTCNEGIASCVLYKLKDKYTNFRIRVLKMLNTWIYSKICFIHRTFYKSQMIKNSIQNYISRCTFDFFPQHFLQNFSINKFHNLQRGKQSKISILLNIMFHAPMGRFQLDFFKGSKY